MEWDAKELIDGMKEMDEAGEIEKLIGRLVAFEYDFSKKSLQYFEHGIYFFIPEQLRKEPPFSLLLTMAYYFGETLIRNFPGAAWKEGKMEDPRELTVILPIGENRIEIRPLLRADKFLQDKEDNFMSSYEMAESVISGKINLVDFRNAGNERQWISKHSSFTAKQSNRFDYGPLPEE